MPQSMLDLLAHRRSVVANKLGEPGPNPDQLARMLEIGARVPDHKKLEPWRFVVFEDEARAQFGALLAAIAILEEPELPSPTRLATEAGRFLRAPVVIAVISCVRDKPGVPEWEQILSAGAVCQNLLVAANCSGFSAQWITEWYGFSPTVSCALGLVKANNERLAGFVYIGTAQEPPVERSRPDMAAIVTHWRPPAPSQTQ